MLHFFLIDTVSLVIKYSFPLDVTSVELILSSSFASECILCPALIPGSFFFSSFRFFFFLQVENYFYFATLYESLLEPQTLLEHISQATSAFYVSYSLIPGLGCSKGKLRCVAFFYFVLVHPANLQYSYLGIYKRSCIASEQQICP